MQSQSWRPVSIRGLAPWCRRWLTALQAGRWSSPSATPFPCTKRCPSCCCRCRGSTAPSCSAFAEKVARAPPDRGLGLFVALLSQLEERTLRGAYAALAAVPGEDALLRHLRTAVPLDRWSRLWESLKTEALRADDLNLDKKQLVLNAFFGIEAASQL
jgi:hypothetical protein